jgi:hypothetical protein
LRSSEVTVIDEGALEVFGPASGSVTLGWVGDGVFFAKFLGSLSADVGMKHAARLQSILEQVPSLHYFSDSSTLESYDLLARSAFARVVLANRRKFASITLLTWPQGITPTTLAFVAAVGDPVDVLTDSLEFERRLLRAAPLARQKLDPRTWIQSPVLPRPSR